MFVDLIKQKKIAPVTNICSHVKQNLFPDGILVATSHVWNSSRSTGQIREGSGIEREKEPDHMIFHFVFCSH